MVRLPPPEDVGVQVLVYHLRDGTWWVQGRKLRAQKAQMAVIGTTMVLRVLLEAGDRHVPLEEYRRLSRDRLLLHQVVVLMAQRVGGWLEKKKIGIRAADLEEVFLLLGELVLSR